MNRGLPITFTLSSPHQKKKTNFPRHKMLQPQEPLRSRKEKEKGRRADVSRGSSPARARIRGPGPPPFPPPRPPRPRPRGPRGIPPRSRAGNNAAARTPAPAGRPPRAARHSPPRSVPRCPRRLQRRRRRPPWPWRVSPLTGPEIAAAAPASPRAVGPRRSAPSARLVGLPSGAAPRAPSPRPGSHARLSPPRRPRRPPPSNSRRGGRVARA